MIDFYLENWYGKTTAHVNFTLSAFLAAAKQSCDLLFRSHCSLVASHGVSFTRKNPISNCIVRIDAEWEKNCCSKFFFSSMKIIKRVIVTFLKLSINIHEQHLNVSQLNLPPSGWRIFRIKTLINQFACKLPHRWRNNNDTVDNFQLASCLLSLASCSFTQVEIIFILFTL